jgi:hypothetical protein
MAQVETISTSDTLYNVWRRDIAAEYVLLTGKAYPRMGTKARGRLSSFLVWLSDNCPSVKPNEVVALLIYLNYLPA